MDIRSITRSSGSFVRERMTQALSVRGLLDKELAARLGVTSTTVSRWKNGAQVPSSTMLEALAAELRVATHWLGRPIRPAIAKPNYRGSVAQMKAERELLGGRVAWLEEASSQLEEYVEYPKVNLPDLQLRSLLQISDEVIEDAAEACRKLWGLGDGPAGDLLLLLENSGVVVALEETGVARIEGLSTWTDRQRPLVLLCADKGNAFRSRFDAAHELGHLVLHRYLDGPSDASTHKLMEQHAHRFAGAFLLPARGFVPEVSSPVSLQALLVLKQRWGVSVAAMIMRLRALGIVSEEDYLRLIKHRSAKWGNKQEPLDGDREIEQPRLLRRTLELLINEGVVRPDGISDLLGISPQDVESLFGLPFGFLSRQKADIVDLALRRQGETAALRNAETGVSNILAFERRLK